MRPPSSRVLQPLATALRDGEPHALAAGERDDTPSRVALDGLFLMMAEEEKALRADPVGKGTDIVKKVFGALGK